MTPDLGRIEIPGAAEAEERAARVVAAAFADSPPRHRPRRAARPIAAVAVAVVLIAAVLSPPGRAFVDHVRRAVGVDHARPALFTLPAPGRILVTAGSGTWVTYADGSRRLLGAYDDASWSPFGRYIAATRPNELVTLDTEGTVRWTLARPGVRFPRWTGSATNTRIAFLSGDRLHVVAGDGKSDFVAGDAPAAGIPPAWSSSLGFILAYADTDGRVQALITAKGGSLWSATPPGAPQSVEWSSDGRQLLILSPAGSRSSTAPAAASSPASRRPTSPPWRTGRVPRRMPSSIARRPGAASRSARARCSALAASSAASPGRRTGAGSSSARRIRPVGVHPRRRKQDRRRVEYLRPVPLAVVPRGRGVVLRWIVGSGHSLSRSTLLLGVDAVTTSTPDTPGAPAAPAAPRDHDRHEREDEREASPS